MWCGRCEAKLKFCKVSDHHHVDDNDDVTSVEQRPDARSTSVEAATFQRLQEDVIELESVKRRLRGVIEV